MKMLIMNGPRQGEVVDIPSDRSEWTLPDPLEPVSVFGPEAMSPTTAMPPVRRYVRGIVTREGATALRVREGATGIIYDPVQAKKDAAAEAIAKRERAAWDAMTPWEQQATRLCRTAYHRNTDHCESCEQDGEFPCCAALRATEPQPMHDGKDQ